MATITVVSGTQIDLAMVPWKAEQKPKPTHPLHGVKVKIARADEHIKNLDRRVKQFSGSHRIVREMEPDGIHEAVKLVVPPIPERMLVLVSETILHLRSALDNLAYALAVRNGKSPSGVYFPIAGSRKEFEDASTQRKIKKLSSAARRFIGRLKPYKGGTNLLWAMNRLRNEDVHIRLMSLIVNGPHWNVRVATVIIPANPLGAYVEITTSQSFENEIVLARCAHGAKIDYDTKPTLGVAFSDIEPLKGESVVSGLYQMISFTKRIVDICERRFF